MNRRRLTISAPEALRWVLGVGLLFMLGANLPGHMSYDSIAQLSEGHFQVRNTWGPAIYAWLLGLFDRFVPGSGLYVVASALVLFVSLASFSTLRGRVWWPAVAVAALIMLTPQVLVYQAIVWKDVMFANCAVAGMVFLAHAAKHWDAVGRRLGYLAGAVVFLGAATLLRQNGVVMVPLAGLAVGWIASRSKWRRGAAWGGGLMVVIMLVAQMMNFAALPSRNAPDDAVSQGVRIVQNYDVVGAAALDRGYGLDRLTAVNPAAADVIRARAALSFSGERVDVMARDQILGAALAQIPDDLMSAQWLDLVLRNPALYLRVRSADFMWVFATPAIERCLPVHVGIEAPAFKLDPLKIRTRYTDADTELANYTSWFLDTPVISHVIYGLLCLVIAVVLLIRRSGADIVMAGLALGGLAFAASFFVISIACDYRYLYFTDLAALTCLLYVAVDPPFIRRRKSATEASA